MKIPLVGASYTSRSVVAAAQQTMNLYPEKLEEPESAPSVLYGRPGLKLFATLSPTKIRGMWSGGGRLFVVHGNTLSEVHEDGTVTARTGTLAESPVITNPDLPYPDPATISSNGNQLMITSGGRVYCDNGAGPVQCNFTEAGHGDTFSADSSIRQYATDTVAFDPSWVGTNMIVDGHIYTITAVVMVAPRKCILTPVPPDNTNVIWEAGVGPPVDGVTGGFLDGYGIVNRIPTSGVAGDPGRQFAISDLNDFTRWNPLDFGVKEGASDYIASILCDHEELWLFGHETTEVWSNTGNPDFPFQRQPGAYIHEGIVAVFAPCSVGLSICGLAGGANGATVAFRIQGLQPQRISTYAQEIEWTKIRVDDAVSYGYNEGGHTFWVVNFWQAQRTWVYDLTTGLWHERAGWDPVLQHFTRYQPWFHAFLAEWGPAEGKHIVGDPVTGKLYEQSVNYTDDDGVDIQHLRALPHLVNEDQYFYHHRFELLMEVGVNPQMTVGLDWSDDGGHTFVTYPAVPSLKDSGAVGDLTKRLVWRRLGKGRKRIYRVGVLGKGLVALVEAYLEATPGFA